MRVKVTAAVMQWRLRWKFKLLDYVDKRRGRKSTIQCVKCGRVLKRWLLVTADKRNMPVCSCRRINVKRRLTPADINRRVYPLKLVSKKSVVTRDSEWFECTRCGRKKIHCISKLLKRNKKTLCLNCWDVDRIAEINKKIAPLEVLHSTLTSTGKRSKRVMFRCNECGVEDERELWTIIKRGRMMCACHHPQVRRKTSKRRAPTTSISERNFQEGLKAHRADLRRRGLVPGLYYWEQPKYLRDGMPDFSDIVKNIANVFAEHEGEL